MRRSCTWSCSLHTTRSRLPLTTRLTMTSQHRGEKRTPRSNRSMSSKGEKSSMVVPCFEGSCYNMKEALRNQARRRRCDRNFRSSRGQESSGVCTQHDYYKTTGKFDALTESESLESKVPIVRLATGCVSRPRDGHYRFIWIAIGTNSSHSQRHLFRFKKLLMTLPSSVPLTLAVPFLIPGNTLKAYPSSIPC